MPNSMKQYGIEWGNTGVSELDGYKVFVRDVYQVSGSDGNAFL